MVPKSSPTTTTAVIHSLIGGSAAEWLCCMFQQTHLACCPMWEVSVGSSSYMYH